MKTSLRICALAAAAATILPATASAAPVTVTLRIEGPTSTLYEGPVTTDVRQFHFTGDATQHTCDATKATGGSSPTPVVTRGAVVAAAIDGGLDFRASWSSAFNTLDFISGPVKVNGTDVSYDAGSGAYLSEFLDGGYTMMGACTDPVHDGDEVLFAYTVVGFGGPPNYDPVPPTLLKLSGVPATLAPGATATAKVTDTAGAPIAGATVDGRTTAADGTVQIGPFTATGPRILKAEKSGDVRSNGGQVCVTDGADGACGTVKPISAAQVAQSTSTGCFTFGSDGRCGTQDDMPPLVRLTDLTAKTYAKGKAPRELTGTAGNFKNDGTLLTDPSGLKDVRLRITRYVGRKCWTFDGTAERFKPLAGSCGTGKGKFFSVGSKPEWSYLLPAPLKPGKYRVEAFAVDGKGHTDKVRRWNRNHVVFQVK